MIMDLIDFVPKNLDNRDVFVKGEKDYLVISCNKIRPPKPIKIKRKINVDESFLEVIGLYFGDGTNSKTGSGSARVALNNTNFVLHEQWIKFLKKIGIYKSDLYAQIQKGYNTKLLDIDFINYWVNKTNIPQNNFCKTISIKKFNCMKYGLLTINYHSKIFRKIFDNLFEFSLNLCKTDKRFATSFIKGLFAAEGYVRINKYGSLAWLDIPIKDLQKRNFVSNIFKSLNIKFRDSGIRLIICGYLNFKIFNRFGLANLHPNKRENFNIGFQHLINYGSVPALTKLRIIELLKSGPKTRFQISKNSNLEISNIHKSLRDLEIKGIVKRENKVLSTNNRKLRQNWFLVKIPSDILPLMDLDYCSRKKLKFSDVF